ncbi:MAG: putative toxin-antitoxin system toxin component, PIN family [Actinomycetota bacterium]
MAKPDASCRSVEESGTPVRIVLDADCIVAGTLAKSGSAFELLELWWAGELEIIGCPHLVEEVRKTLLAPRIANKYAITDLEVEALCAQLSDRGLIYADPEDPPRVVIGDPDDDYLIALGLQAHAEALVTRDSHFEDVKVEGLPIMYPGQLLTALHSQKDPDG